MLQRNLDRQQPDDNLLNLLAGLHLKAERDDEAEELYRLGAERHPTAAELARSLAKVYLAQGNDVKLAEVLAQLAVLDGDDLPVRKKLMQLALSARISPLRRAGTRIAAYRRDGRRDSSHAGRGGARTTSSPPRRTNTRLR